MAWTTPATATVGQVFTAAWVNTYVRDNTAFLYGDRQYVTAEVDVANTIVETTILSKTIAAGIMGTDRSVSVRMMGDYLNSTGSSQASNFRIKHGGVTIFDENGLIPTNGARRAFFCEFVIANRGAANSQQLGGRFGLGPPNSAITGLGDLGAVGDYVSVFSSDGWTLDTSSAQTLTVTVQHPTASANLSWRLRYARLVVE